jgi:hypothetical protein
MKKLIKNFKAWLACVTRTDMVWIVYKPEPDSEITVLLVTYEMESALEYMTGFNRRNDGGAWLTKQTVV